MRLVGAAALGTVTQMFYFVSYLDQTGYIGLQELAAVKATWQQAAESARVTFAPSSRKDTRHAKVLGEGQGGTGGGGGWTKCPWLIFSVSVRVWNLGQANDWESMVQNLQMAWGPLGPIDPLQHKLPAPKDYLPLGQRLQDLALTWLAVYNQQQHGATAPPAATGSASSRSRRTKK